MSLELHIWGPGFGLPSIDAECLACIAYLRRCRPQRSWLLVPTSRPNVSPHGELPVLKHKGLWIPRFNNIIAYLRHISNGDWDLDQGVTSAQQADITAFTSFILSRGQPLLDLSLYVSSENYTNCTRSELYNILEWPESWTVPGRLREKAKKRSEHLGLSGLDIDIAKQEEKGEDSGLTAHIPHTLRRPKQTVSIILGKSASKDRFKLDAITANFLEPLEDLLAKKKWLIGSKMTSIDCLAVGYLALMQAPVLPQGWLRTALKEKYKDLGTWAEGCAVDSFMMSPDRKVNGKASFGLPWKSPTSATWSDKYGTLLEGLIHSLPVVNSISNVVEINPKSEPGLDSFASKQKAVVRIRKDQFMYSQLVTSILGMGVLTSYLVYSGLLKLPTGGSVRNSRSFGEAGNILGLK